MLPEATVGGKWLGPSEIVEEASQHLWYVVDEALFQSDHVAEGARRMCAASIAHVDTLAIVTDGAVRAALTNVYVLPHAKHDLL